jgi:hypothetical protein
MAGFYSAPLAGNYSAVDTFVRFRTQVRIATPEGDYWFAVTLPGDPYQRSVILRNLSLFMAWKQALGFTLASELYEPGSVYCAGITLKERCACLARINREPRPWVAKNFGTVEWLPEASIDPFLLDLLPRGAREVTSGDIQTHDEWFGMKGKFPGEDQNRRSGNMTPPDLMVVKPVYLLVFAPGLEELGP